MTRVVLLTAPGRAAIATLLVAGPRATEIVSRLFQPAGKKSLSEQPLGRIVFGRWPAGTVAEEVVVCRTAADRVEVNCHGGVAAPRAIASSLIAAGCEEFDWRTWTRESLADPLAADAEIALADAPTERTARILLDQRSGALRRQFDAIAGAIRTGDAAGAVSLVDELLARMDVGLHLAKPWRVVLAGRPNVGKSSLINALVGYERAIVHAAPGTTRDIVTALTALDGWPVELADTAGLRLGDEPLEAAGIELAREQAAAADLLLLVFDRSAAWSVEDDALAKAWPAALVIHNKCDLPAAGDRPAGVEVSAQSGVGLAELARAVVSRLVPNPPEPGDAVPFLESHVELLERLKQSLAAGQHDRALKQIADVGCHRQLVVGVAQQQEGSGKA